MRATILFCLASVSIVALAACTPAQEVPSAAQSGAVATFTAVPTATVVATSTAIPTPIATPVPTAIATSLPALTPEATPTPTPTATAIATPRPTPTLTQTERMAAAVQTAAAGLPSPTPTPTPLGYTREETIARTSPSIVLIETPGGCGSGTIFRPDGYILTHWHVIEGYTRVTVIVSETRTVVGNVVGFDAILDLAVIKLPGSDWPFISISGYQKPAVGEEVIMLGYPFCSYQDRQVRATKGIVSGYDSYMGLEQC